MSTRASVIITKNRWEILFDNDKQCLRHHCDGQPNGVGSDLVGLLKEYSKNTEIIGSKEHFLHLFKTQTIHLDQCLRQQTIQNIFI